MRRFWYVIVALSGLGLVACATHWQQPAPQHVVFVNRDGQLQNPTNGFPTLTNQLAHDYLAELTTSLATNQFPTGNVRQIVIFVHGGLNPAEDGLDRAANLLPAIQTNAYPIFVVWDSGLMSSYCEHLWRIRQGQVEKNWLWSALTCPVYLFADAGRALTRAPMVWYYQSRNDLSTLAYHPWSPVRPLLQPLLPAKLTPEDKLQRMKGTQQHRATDKHGETESVKVDISLGADHRREHPFNNALRMTTYIVTIPFKLLTAPFIDAMGKAAWDNMSRRTQTMFCQPSYFELPGHGHPHITIGKSPNGGLSQFMEQLATFVQTNKSHHYEITVIGHSMGAMVLNEAIRRYPGLPYRNIVYMAAACSSRDFATSVIPCLQLNPQAQFYYLGLHPVNEARELHFYAGELAPLGSLLAWIDNYLTDPQTVPDRTFGSFDNLYACSPSLPTNIADRLHFKIFPVDADPHYPEGNPQTHGGFGETSFWEKAFWEPKHHLPPPPTITVPESPSH